MRTSILLTTLAISMTFVDGLSAVAAPSLTPNVIIDSSRPEEWVAVPDEDLMIFSLENGSQFIVQLAPRFDPEHVRNIRVLASQSWWDRKTIYRVQDNYVAQWGDVSEKAPLPPMISSNLKQMFERPLSSSDRFTELKFKDAYAAKVGFVEGWPVAINDGKMSLTHCYGTVGVARNLSPDAGTGAELYAVIGQAPRQLDRNIAIVGRVVEGMDVLASLPRGRGELGFYTDTQTPPRISSARMVSSLAESERPKVECLSTSSFSFAEYARLRANRKDDFFNHPAGGVDVCNVPVPIRIHR